MEVQVLVSEEPTVAVSLHTLKCWCFSMYDLVFVQFALESKTLITFITRQGFLVMFIHVSGELEWCVQQFFTGSTHHLFISSFVMVIQFLNRILHNIAQFAGIFSAFSSLHLEFVASQFKVTLRGTWRIIGVVFVVFGKLGSDDGFGLFFCSDTVETTEPSQFAIMVVVISVSSVWSGSMPFPLFAPGITNFLISLCSSPVPKRIGIGATSTVLLPMGNSSLLSRSS